jgi:competence protein ComEC
MLLIFLSCVWILGIFLGYKIDLPLWSGIAAAGPLVFAVFLRRNRKPLILAALGILLFVAAAAYSYASLNTVDESRVSFYNDGGVYQIEAKIVSDPDVRDQTAYLTVEASAIKLEAARRDIEGTVLVFVPRYPAYRYGDVLRITGELRTPPQLGDFDYRGYLAHQGIYATMLYPEIEVLETGRGFAPLAWVYSLRARLSQTLAQVLPEPQASLARGIVLGIRGDIPPELRDDFSRSGTAHLLAISGLHLGVMAGILLGIGLWLFGRRRHL